MTLYYDVSDTARAIRGIIPALLFHGRVSGVHKKSPFCVATQTRIQYDEEQHN